MLDIGQRELPSFDRPMDLLRACHMRMLTNCATLERLASHLQEKGVDGQARDAARNVYTYFTTAAPLHHQDEEVDVYPALAAAAPNLKPVIETLEREHLQLEQAWDAIADGLANPTRIGDTEVFARHVDTFCSAYRDHIRREEQHLFMPAGHLLDAQRLQQIGTAMARRRNVKLPDASSSA
ncbi:hemerythrin domain-containing protein [Thiohalobacter sp.]|uniref:hemerythrin domain-containing protein n=1 Tax=Thiohalobacter sp. TaxID=2025948 RepID=UPI002636D711|nr:hemerythrin domain-containing protein [Thiohalobacter sp.]